MSYSEDLRSDIEEAMESVLRAKRFMDLIYQKAGMAPEQGPTEAEIFAASFDKAAAPTEIRTSERMASLAGKLENHKEANVRDLAALVLRHVRRQEGEG